MLQTNATALYVLVTTKNVFSCKLSVSLFSLRHTLRRRSLTSSPRRDESGTGGAVHTGHGRAHRTVLRNGGPSTRLHLMRTAQTRRVLPYIVVRMGFWPVSWNLTDENL